MIPARPLCKGVRESVWDPETLRERVGDWGGPETVWALLCVAERRATRPNGEWGYSTRRHMLGPERPKAVSPGRGVVITDLQSSIDCQQTSLSLCLSLSLSVQVARTRVYFFKFSGWCGLKMWVEGEREEMHREIESGRKRETERERDMEKGDTGSLLTW